MLREYVAYRGCLTHTLISVMFLQTNHLTKLAVSASA